MKRTVLTAVISAAALTTLLAGCAGSATPTAESSSEPNASLSIGFNTTGGQTPTYVAIEEGIFDQNGLDVERVEFQDATTMISALQRGDIDLMSSIPGAVLAARAAGLDVQAIIQNEAARYEAPDSGTIIAAAGSGIDSVEDLSGKTIGAFGGMRGQLSANALHTLADAGVAADMVTLIEAPFATHLDLLKSGQVDAVITVDPFTTSIVEAGVGEVIAYPYIEANPGQPLSAWWAPREWIEANPDLVEAFQQSLIESIDWLYEDEDRARTTVAEFTGLDPVLIEAMPLNNWSYNLDEDAWNTNIDILLEQGELPGPMSTDEYWAESMSQFVADSALGR